MPPLKPGTIIPTDDEDAAIGAGIAADPDTFELSDEHFARLRPVRRGRPKAESPKIGIRLRIDADIVDRFRATGPGWQTRMNDALRQALPE